MQQQASQMFNTQPSQQPPQQPQTMLTTEQIQKYLEENKNLIMAIMESQNMGKLNECAQYQAQLQKNLMYLAAIADAQPPPSTPPTGPSQPQPQPQPQTPVQSTTPQGLFMQPSQPAITQQQTGAYGARLPFPVQSFDQQSPHVQHQQTMAGVMGMRFPPPNSGFHPAMQAGHGTHFMDPHSRQDGSEAGSGDGQGK